MLDSRLSVGDFKRGCGCAGKSNAKPLTLGGEKRGIGGGRRGGGREGGGCGGGGGTHLGSNKNGFGGPTGLRVCDMNCDGGGGKSGSGGMPLRGNIEGDAGTLLPDGDWFNGDNRSRLTSLLVATEKRAGG